MTLAANKWIASGHRTHGISLGIDAQMVIERRTQAFSGVRGRRLEGLSSPAISAVLERKKYSRPRLLAQQRGDVHAESNACMNQHAAPDGTGTKGQYAEKKSK